jgi:hypothetical protein
VIEYKITGSESPNSFDCPAAGVTVIARPTTVVLSDVLELAYVLESARAGVNSADNAAEPNATGTQSHVAVVVAVTAPQPEIVVPPNLKFTVPARDVVAVMTFVVRY